MTQKVINIGGNANDGSGDSLRAAYTKSNENFSELYAVVSNMRDFVNNAQSAAYILVATDNGKMINITTGGVTVDAGIFSAGNNIRIYNNSSSSQTIGVGTGVTMYLAGTSSICNQPGDTFTLAQRGFVTIVCVAVNTFVISGSGLT